MHTYNPNAPEVIKFAINLRAINQETYLVKGSLYSMRETLSSLCSDVTAGTQGEVEMTRIMDMYNEAQKIIHDLNRYVGAIKAKGDFNNTEYFSK